MNLGHTLVSSPYCGWRGRDGLDPLRDELLRVGALLKDVRRRGGHRRAEAVHGGVAITPIVVIGAPVAHSSDIGPERGVVIIVRCQVNSSTRDKLRQHFILSL